MKYILNHILSRFGFIPKEKYQALNLRYKNALLSHEKEISNMRSDFTKHELEMIEKVKPFTMTSPERIVSLIRALEYLLQNGIDGDFVECGVWRGGSAMIMADYLTKDMVNDRRLYLYDTYEGMVAPTDRDKNMLGKKAQEIKDAINGNWCEASLDEVKENIFSTGIHHDSVYFIVGKVEDTINTQKPSRISLLRLDTDWYESTKIELEALYDLIVPGGVIIIDDYGHWTGCKNAVDEFITNRKLPVFLSRIDYTGRIFVKN